MYDQLLSGDVKTLHNEELMDYLFMLEDLLQDLLAHTRQITAALQKNGCS